MSWLKFLRRTRADAELQQEIEAYLEEETAENVARGLSPEEARRQARIKFGGTQSVRESLWEQNSISVFDHLWRDLRYAARTLARTPGFTTTAVLVMALGIGTNAALFTVVRSVLLTPLPYRDPGRLVSVYERDSRSTGPTPFLPVDAGSFAVWKQTSPPLADLAMVSPWQAYNVSDARGRLPEKISAAWCSWNFFSVLGVRPELGRMFNADDDRPDAAATVVLSHSLWVRRYGQDRAIVGQSISLDARPYTVIGVLPASFSYSSSFGGSTVQAWTAVTHEAPPALLSAFDDHEFLVVGRLYDGARLPALLERLGAAQKRIEHDHPLPTVHNSVTGRPMLDDVVEDYRTPLYALLAATGCVLLIACMNVAGLLVARTAARSRDMAIRRALGGSRMRLIGERLMESLVLSAAGGALGLLFASGALQWLVSVRRDMNRVEAIHIDAVVVAFVAGIVVLAAALSGLVTGISADTRNLVASLQEGGRAQAGGRSRARLRRGLLAVQIGLTVVLLVGAALLLKSYQRLRTTDIGVPVDNVLTLHVSLPEIRYHEPAQPVVFFEQLIERVRALPGVTAAGLVTAAPGEGWGGDHMMSVVEHPHQSMDDDFDVMIRAADPGYFSAIHIPLLRGRTFSAEERLERAHVAVISESLARRAFPREDPIGKHLQGVSDNRVLEVVGVVGDTRWNIREPVRPTLYSPIYGNGHSAATIVVRSTRDVESLAIPVQKVVSQMDPTLPVSSVMTLRQALANSMIASEFDSTLVAAFAAIALVLAVTGLYGVLAYVVMQRTSEIGIRIALGARRQHLLRQVMFDGLRPVFAGLALGLAASVATVRLIRSMLYDTRALDAGVFVLVTVVLLAVSCAACLLPAWRASRLDPLEALRSE